MYKGIFNLEMSHWRLSRFHYSGTYRVENLKQKKTTGIYRKKKIPVVDLILKDSNYVSAIYHGD